LEGLGAGSEPTSASVLSDIMRAAQDGTPLNINLDSAQVMEPGESVGRNYIRMTVLDRPGVTAEITKIIGDNRINIDEIRQLESATDGTLANTVFLTGFSGQGSLHRAIREISDLDVCQKINSVMRVMR